MNILRGLFGTKTETETYEYYTYFIVDVDAEGYFDFGTLGKHSSLSLAAAIDRGTISQKKVDEFQRRNIGRKTMIEKFDRGQRPHNYLRVV